MCLCACVLVGMVQLLCPHSFIITDPGREYLYICNVACVFAGHVSIYVYSDQVSSCARKCAQVSAASAGSTSWYLPVDDEMTGI